MLCATDCWRIRLCVLRSSVTKAMPARIASRGDAIRRGFPAREISPRTRAAGWTPNSVSSNSVPASPHQPGDANDFAAAHIEGNLAQLAAASTFRRGGG